MRRKLVVGNWKMHGGLSQNQLLFNNLTQQLQDLQEIDIAVCVPYPYLHQAKLLLAGSNVKWGAQNISRFSEGAYTASISAEMVADFGCSYALIGHSERRAASHESNHSAAQRFSQALQVGITPIFCVGETLAERQAGLAQSIVKNQMLAILDGLDSETFELAKQHHAVIAYEPVWAIGAKQTAQPIEAQEMHHFIRNLVSVHDADYAATLRLIYGGSVTPENANSLFSMPDIDGGLIGRSSLDALKFRRICEVAGEVTMI
jgi:triosephosphate isomerase